MEDTNEGCERGCGGRFGAGDRFYANAVSQHNDEARRVAVLMGRANARNMLACHVKVCLRRSVQPARRPRW